MSADEQDLAAITAKVNFIQWVIGGMATAVLVYMLAAIPWAMVMHANMTKVTTKIEHLVVPPVWFKAKVDENREHINANASSIRSLERRLDAIKQD